MIVYEKYSFFSHKMTFFEQKNKLAFDYVRTKVIVNILFCSNFFIQIKTKSLHQFDVQTP